MNVYLVEIVTDNGRNRATMIFASKAGAMVEIGAHIPGCDFIDHDETGTIGFDDACVSAAGLGGSAHIWRMPVKGFVSL